MSLGGRNPKFKVTVLQKCLYCSPTEVKQEIVRHSTIISILNTIGKLIEAVTAQRLNA
jgi:hypothetical protein